MLAQNCPVAVRAMLRWTSRAAAGVIAALVSVSPAFSRPFPQQTNSSLTQIHPAKKSLSMVFVDPSGTPVAHTKVTLRPISGQNEFTAESNQAGYLPKGTYELTTAICPGFRLCHLTEVEAPYGPKMQLSLGLGLMGEVVAVGEPNYQPDKIHRLFESLKHPSSDQLRCLRRRGTAYISSRMLEEGTGT
jgi:hypothetical protein